MKRIFISCALFLCTISLSAQTKMSAKEAAVKIADRILDSTTYEFKNRRDMWRSRRTQRYIL